MKREAPTTVAELVDGLLLFDEPILNSRFHAVLSRDPIPERQESLRELPGRITDSHTLAHIAAHRWMRMDRGELSGAFVERAERYILESYLSLAESQIRLIAFMARAAPTADIRRPFDRMAQKHREVCESLRSLLSEITRTTLPPESPTRSVQEEENSGDMRSQVEAALRARRAEGAGTRRVLLSHIAHRHLRDQGCFQRGDTMILGVPVAIDLSWSSSAFAIEGYDVVPLEEIVDWEAEAGRTTREEASREPSDR